MRAQERLLTFDHCQPPPFGGGAPQPVGELIDDESGGGGRLGLGALGVGIGRAAKSPGEGIGRAARLCGVGIGRAAKSCGDGIGRCVSDAVSGGVGLAWLNDCTVCACCSDGC